MTIACGSLGEPGEESHAETFYRGLDVHPLDYTAAARAEDPLGADPPFQPPTRTARSAGPGDRPVDDAAFERLVSAWEGQLGRAGAAMRTSSTCITSRR